MLAGAAPNPELLMIAPNAEFVLPPLLLLLFPKGLLEFVGWLLTLLVLPNGLLPPNALLCCLLNGFELFWLEFV